MKTVPGFTNANPSSIAKIVDLLDSGVSVHWSELLPGPSGYDLEFFIDPPDKEFPEDGYSASIMLDVGDAVELGDAKYRTAPQAALKTVSKFKKTLREIKDREAKTGYFLPPRYTYMRGGGSYRI